MDTISNINKMLMSVLKIDHSVVSNLSTEQVLTDYGLNSLTAIQLVVQIENEYGVTIDDIDLLLENMTTINKIVALIEKYTQ